jgi:hypothetical protein
MPNRTLNQSSDVDTPDAKDRVDEASAESMVASYPPAYGGVSGVGAPPATVDDEARLEAIRCRAHRLWEAAGRPHGNDLRFWLQAERELAAGNDRG